MGRYEEALAAFDRTRAILAVGSIPLALLAITSADMGRMAEARAAVQTILNNQTHPSAKRYVDALDYKDRAKSERALATLRQLGLPE